MSAIPSLSPTALLANAEARAARAEVEFEEFEDFEEFETVEELEELEELDALEVGDPDARDPEIEIVRPVGGRPSHLRVAPTVSKDVLRRRRRARIAVIGVAVLSAASMFTLVAFHVFAVQSAFQLDKLDSNLASEQRQYELLRDKVATLSSPQSITNAAASYGMVRAPSVIQLHAPTSAPFGSDSLPVPPATPYSAIATPGP